MAESITSNVFVKVESFNSSISVKDKMSPNMIEDPKELNEVAFNYPEIVSKMDDFMKKAHTIPKIDKFKIPVIK